MKAYQNLVVNIPHSSMFIPAAFRSLFYLKQHKLNEELLKMTDLYTDELFCSEARTLVFPVTRLICDVERFRKEKDEVMSKFGMWICYTRTSEQEKLKRVDAKHKREILRNYYDTYHAMLTQTVEEKLQGLGSCLIVDGHSFPTKNLYYENIAMKELPEICIGTDAFHTSKLLSEFTCTYFKGKGLEVMLNAPYAGTIVPLTQYHKNKAVQSIMIEVNRSIYMNEITGEKKREFVWTKEILNEYLRKVSEL
jgi:N-formylglutamate amidohydrolase